MQPRALCGVRDWVNRRRNVFAVVILLLFNSFFEPPLNLQIFYSLSALLSGYNIGATIDHTWKHLLSPSLDMPSSIQGAKARRASYKGFLSSMLGLGVFGAGLVLLNYAPDDVGGFRD